MYQVIWIILFLNVAMTVFNFKFYLFSMISFTTICNYLYKSNNFVYLNNHMINTSHKSKTLSINYKFYNNTFELRT